MKQIIIILLIINIIFNKLKLKSKHDPNDQLKNQIDIKCEFKQDQDKSYNQIIQKIYNKQFRYEFLDMVQFMTNTSTQSGTSYYSRKAIIDQIQRQLSSVDFINKTKLEKYSTQEQEWNLLFETIQIQIDDNLFNNIDEFFEFIINIYNIVHSDKEKYGAQFKYHNLDSLIHDFIKVNLYCGSYTKVIYDDEFQLINLMRYNKFKIFKMIINQVQRNIHLVDLRNEISSQDTLVSNDLFLIWFQQNQFIINTKYTMKTLEDLNQNVMEQLYKNVRNNKFNDQFEPWAMNQSYIFMKQMQMEQMKSKLDGYLKNMKILLRDYFYLYFYKLGILKINVIDSQNILNDNFDHPHDRKDIVLIEKYQQYFRAFAKLFYALESDYFNRLAQLVTLKSFFEYAFMIISSQEIKQPLKSFLYNYYLLCLVPIVTNSSYNKQMIQVIYNYQQKTFLDYITTQNYLDGFVIKYQFMQVKEQITFRIPEDQVDVNQDKTFKYATTYQILYQMNGMIFVQNKIIFNIKQDFNNLRIYFEQKSDIYVNGFKLIKQCKYESAKKNTIIKPIVVLFKQYIYEYQYYYQTLIPDSIYIYNDQNIKIFDLNLKNDQGILGTHYTKDSPYQQLEKLRQQDILSFAFRESIINELYLIFPSYKNEIKTLKLEIGLNWIDIIRVKYMTYLIATLQVPSRDEWNKMFKNLIIDTEKQVADFNSDLYSCILTHGNYDDFIFNTTQMLKDECRTERGLDNQIDQHTNVHEIFILYQMIKLLEIIRQFHSKGLVMEKFNSELEPVTNSDESHFLYMTVMSINDVEINFKELKKMKIKKI